MTTFVTFMQFHSHRINGITFDIDSIAVIQSDTASEGREKAFEYFGPKFCFEYYNECPDLLYFPRGCIWVPGEEIKGLT